MSSNQQLACTYAAFLLSDSGKCDAASIMAVTKAAGVEVNKNMATAFEIALRSVNINNVISSISFAGGAPSSAGAGGAAAPSAASAAAAPATAAAAAKEEEEEDDDMGFGLFD